MGQADDTQPDELGLPQADHNRLGSPHRPIDAETGFDIRDGFARFPQRLNIFSRSYWDPEVKSAKATAFYEGYFMPKAKARKADGYNLRDYALRNAAWHFTKAFGSLKTDEEGRIEGVTDVFTLHSPGWHEPWPIDDTVASTRETKRVAKLFGAQLVGICDYDERWMFSAIYRRADVEHGDHPVEIPDDMKHVIVVGTAMDYDLTATVPSALAATATGLGYTTDAVTLMLLAQYIRNLGYRAYASMNDSALSVPLAIQAGLGELGRHSMVITPEFGPRVRFGKVFTDMPLVADKPKKFGITEFCNTCQACAAACPPRAIPFGEPSVEPPNKSSFSHIRKWSTNAEKCFNFWGNQNTECSICIRVCPYNRHFKTWWDKSWRWLAGTRMRRVALWLDRFRDAGRMSAKSWWAR